MDLVVRSPNLPVKGETISGYDFFTAPGGKGANQAVACARLGVKTHMLGRVGNDIFAQTLLTSLKNNNVIIDGVTTDQEYPSGVALIVVDDASDNSIIVVPGANSRNGPSELEYLEGLLDHASILLLQLEIPIEIVVKAARLAQEKGVRVILDPAPAQELPSSLFQCCDILTPNEIEAGILVGYPVNDQSDAEQVSAELLKYGLGEIIIKMGDKGAFWTDGDNKQFLTAYKVAPIDSVAAGDAFNGGLAAGLSVGLNMNEAIKWGMAAGALSTTKEGAQPSMPDRLALDKMLAEQI